MNSCPPARQLLITFLLRCRGEKTITKQCANCPQQGREKQADPIDTKEDSVMVSVCRTAHFSFPRRDDIAAPKNGIQTLLKRKDSRKKQ